MAAGVVEQRGRDVVARIPTAELITGANANGAGGQTIWIDLDNSPHVPFFRPIIEQLKDRGYEVLITARDCFQVCGLADQLHLEYKPIGRHYGKHQMMKLLGLGIRTLQLLPPAWRTRPALAVSHGSRSQLVAATLLGIPTLQILDYEFAKIWAGVRPSWAMIPTIIETGAVKLSPDRVLQYPGIKEDVYVPSFSPREGIREELGITEADILVTMRPPASEAHYHSAESDTLFRAAVAHLASIPETRMVVLPRTPKQGDEIKARWPELYARRKLLIPERVVDGLNLVWHSDLVISGGGTMNREAAALGIPVYSVFRGTMGSVDRYLAANGRMVLLESAAELASKLVVQRRDHGQTPSAAGQETLLAVTSHIVRLAEMKTQKRLA